MERRLLSLAHNYEFAERLSDFSTPAGANGKKNRRTAGAGTFGRPCISFGGALVN